jgi:DNA polymerase III sliding clamp (beta) subunit (PCNA family)
VHISITAQDIEDGICAIPAHIFSQTIQTLQNQNIQCTLNQDTLVVVSKNTRTVIKTISHEEFPPITMYTERDIVYTYQTKTLINGIKSVAYAASQSMIRPELGSIYISTQGENCTCVATDSFRLAEKTIQQTSGEQKDLLIPSKHITELLLLLEHVQTGTIGLKMRQLHL